MEQQPIPQLFGIIPTGLPPILTPTSAPSPTSLLFTLPPTRPYNHIVVFLLPGTVLPPNSGAAVYIQLPPPSSQAPQLQNPQAGGEFKFLGAIGEGKESAVFRIKGLFSGNNERGNAGGEIDMDAPSSPIPTGIISPITLGISIESATSISSQLALLSSCSTTTNPSHTPSSLSAPNPAHSASNANNRGDKTDTVILAQKIIKNAFNFLASFSGNVNGGVEVVPLKAFESGGRGLRGGLGVIRVFWRGGMETEILCGRGFLDFMGGKIWRCGDWGWKMGDWVGRGFGYGCGYEG